MRIPQEGAFEVGPSRRLSTPSLLQLSHRLPFRGRRGRERIQDAPRRGIGLRRTHGMVPREPWLQGHGEHRHSRAHTWMEEKAVTASKRDGIRPRKLCLDTRTTAKTLYEEREAAARKLYWRARPLRRSSTWRARPSRGRSLRIRGHSRGSFRSMTRARSRRAVTDAPSRSCAACDEEEDH